MRYLLLLLILQSTAFADDLSDLKKIVSLQQAQINRLTCQTKALNEGPKLNCRTIQDGEQTLHKMNSSYPESDNGRVASCAKDEIVTGGGAGGSWGSALVDSFPDKNNWIVRYAEMGKDLQTHRSFWARVICCKIDKADLNACG